MRLEGWLKSVTHLSWAIRSWAIRRDHEKGLREVLRARSTRDTEADVEEARSTGSLPLPRQSGFAGGAS
jgi:hypothetical protein